MILEDLTDAEFQEHIKTLDPAHRVLARIERAKIQMRLEKQAKETPCSGSQSSSASLS